MKTRLLVFIICCAYSAFIFAQAPSIVWQHCLGGSNDDNAAAMQITTAGDYIVAGSSYSDNGDVSGHHGPTSFKDYWVAHTDAAGAVLWQKSYGGSEDDVAYAIVQTTDGGYIVAGYANSDGGQVVGNHGNSDQWILKLSMYGAIEWKTCLGGLAIDYATDIKQTSDGGYIVAGSTYSVEGDITLNHGLGDYWLLKLDVSGAITWQKTFGGSGEDYGTCVIQTTDGGYFISGFTNSTNGDISFNHGGNDTWIVRTDADGNMLWQKTYGGSDWETNTSIIPTHDNGYLVTNSTLSDNYDVSGNHTPFTFYDYWIFKINNAGDLLWQKCYGGTYGDYAIESCATSDNGFIICGASASLDGDVTGHHGVLYGNDNWVVKTDSVGTIEWQLSLGGSLGDYGADIKQNADGSFIVLGSTESNDGDVTGYHGNYDYWLVKLGCTGVTYYADMDGDGFGDPGNDSVSCNIPAGFVSDSSDCNDANALIFPGQTELCNAMDENCNGLVDEGLIFTIYYADMDADGFGDAFSDTLSCNMVSGYILDNTDCNDANTAINPVQPELCNALDDNCNILIDDGLLFLHYYADADDDGFGDPLTDTVTCETPAGYILDDQDCNDANAFVNPLSFELCNNADDNCDGTIDEGLITHVLYVDADGDGFGDATMDTVTCSTGMGGYVSDSTDCDDTNALIFPGAVEVFNGLDDNCNQLIDEGIGIWETELVHFSVYPNPAVQFMQVIFDHPADRSIEIINLQGELVYAMHCSLSQTELDVSQLVPGIYVLRIGNGVNTESITFTRINIQ